MERNNNYFIFVNTDLYLIYFVYLLKISDRWFFVADLSGDRT
ncbi:hypothetical protein ACE1AT_25260 [Pelatocladus sp. BLCC-F211]